MTETEFDSLLTQAPNLCGKLGITKEKWREEQKPKPLSMGACPDCGGPLVPGGGCPVCAVCGWSECS